MDLKTSLEDVNNTSAVQDQLQTRQIEELSKAHQSAQGRIKLLEQQLFDLETRCRELQMLLQSAATESQRLKQQKADLESSRDQLLSKNSDLMEQIEELNAGMYQYQKQNELMELKQEQTEREMELKGKHIQRLEGLLETRKSRLEDEGLTDEDSKAEDFARPLQQFKSDFKQLERRLDESIKKTSPTGPKPRHKDEFGVQENLFSVPDRATSPSPIQKAEITMEYDLPEAFLTEPKDQKSPERRPKSQDRK